MRQFHVARSKLITIPLQIVLGIGKFQLRFILLFYAIRGDAILLLYAFRVLLTVPLHIWRDHVLKTFGTALLLASELAITTAPAFALQTVVTQVDKNTDGSMTYHFAVKTDQGETLTPGQSKATADFVTVSPRPPA
jgi:hypothetical protein